KKELTCILRGELFQSCITSSFTNPIVKVPPSTYTIPGQPFCFCCFPAKNQPCFSFGFQPVLLTTFLVQRHLLVPDPPQLVNASVELNAINENNFSFFIVDINIFKVQRKNKLFNKSSKDLIFLKNDNKLILLS